VHVLDLGNWVLHGLLGDTGGRAGKKEEDGLKGVVGADYIGGAGGLDGDGRRRKCGAEVEETAAGVPPS
jgi:hypothetical protein